MKERTKKDIFDKYIGHKKFAKFIILAENDGHTINNIKEYNEKFKFELDGDKVEFDKQAKDINGYYKFMMATIKFRKEIGL